MRTKAQPLGGAAIGVAVSARATPTRLAAAVRPVSWGPPGPPRFRALREGETISPKSSVNGRVSAKARARLEREVRRLVA